MTFEAARAREYYAARVGGAARGGRARGSSPAEIMGRTYFALLRAIEARRFDVFGPRVALSTRRRLAIAFRCWLGARAGRLVKAAVCDGGAIELREWPVPTPGPRRAPAARERLRALRLRHRSRSTRPRPGRPSSATRSWAQVVEIGAGVRRFAPGDRLVVAHHVPCFRCHYCRRGSPSMCRALQAGQSRSGRLRGAASACPRPTCEHAAFRLPAGMTEETASFTEPLACCLRAVKRSRVARG